MQTPGAPTARGRFDAASALQTALYASAALLGIAALPHCTVMCSAPCAAVVGRDQRASLVFQAARLLAYAGAGAVVAAVVGTLGAASAWSPALRPLWTLLHLAGLALGLFLLWRGRQPAWLSKLGRVPPSALAGQKPVPILMRRTSVLRASAAGGLWVLWPCGVLQSALLVAALGSGAVDGAIAMGVFAAVSAPGLLIGPWVVKHLLAPRGHAAAYERLATRGAGALLVGASGWALGHGLWMKVALLCGWA